MSILSYSMTFHRGGSKQLDRKGNVTEVENRQFIQEFIIIVDSVIDDNAITIPLQSPFPQLGDTYAFFNDADNLASCTHIDCQPHADSPYVWVLTATFDTNRLINNFLDNPLNAPAEIVWSRATYSRPFVIDATGTPVVNSSGEWFDPPLEVEDVRPVLTITRNEVAYNPVIILQYKEAVNSDVFAGSPARTAKINSISSVKQYDAGFTYWRTTYEVMFRPETFDFQVLDQGYRDINHTLFRDPVTQQTMNSPTLLSGRGARLTDATTTLNGAIDATVKKITVTSSAKFPDLGTSLLAQPAILSPPQNYYVLKIGTELLRVIGDQTGNVLQVDRGYNGTTAAAHVDTAPVALQPYFLRFRPSNILPFAPLGLPVV